MIILDQFLAKLEGVKKSGGAYIARCPAHGDRRQSLSVTQGGDGRVLVKCHAGCAFEHIIAAMGLEATDLLPDRERPAPEHATITATYDYVDEYGTLLFQVCRMNPKGFRQRRPDASGGWEWKLGDVRRVPYRLPQVITAAMAGRRIFIVEGEKDVHTLEAWNLVATTNAGGAGKWLEEFAEYLEDAHVVILPDNDEAGIEHARTVNASLDGRVKSVRIIQLPGLPQKGDVTDWVRAGGTLEDLKRLVQSPATIPGVTDMKAIIGGLGRYKTEPMPPGVDYPWQILNRRTRGMRPGWFIIWAGYPSSGKTAALLEICFAAGKRGQRVLLNSLEMSKEELGLRMIQRWGLDTGRLYGNRMTDDDRLAFDLAYNLPGYENVLYCKEKTIPAIAERVVELKPDLVAIDYIGLMDMGRDSLYDGTTKISRGLKDLSLEYKVPTVALSQLTRPPDRGSKEPHIPTMFDLRNSGALEADADHIVIVYRDESKDDEHGHPTGECEGRFIVAKSRHAAAGRPIPFLFDGKALTFAIQDPLEDRMREQGWSVLEGGQA